MRKNIVLIASSVLLVSALLATMVVGCAEKPPAPAAPASPPVTTPAPKPVLPQVINWISQGTGGVGNFAVTAIAETIKGDLGVPVRVIPIDLENARNKALVAGDGHLSLATAQGYVDQMNLSGAYDDPGFQPPLLNLMWAGHSMVGCLNVWGDSDIYTIQDLKGKTVALPEATPVMVDIIDALLAFGGLSLDDVVQIPCGSFGKAITAFGDGVGDFFCSNPVNPPVLELASRPRGIRVLPMPFDDTEGWERFWQKSPLHVKFLFSEGLWKNNPVEVAASMATNVALDSQSEDFMYTMVKALDKNYPKYKDLVTPLGTQLYNFERTIDLSNWEGILIPYHPGFIKYAKELGKWTPEYDAYQAKALAFREQGINGWKAKYAK